MLVNLLAFLVAVGIVVFVHEFGHYAAARWAGIRVGVFSIGFGRPIMSWTDSRGTVWQIGSIPLGGYVRFAEEDGPASAPGNRQGRGDSLANAALHHRAITVAAGPLANFLFSLVVFALVVLATGIVSDQPVIGTLKPLPGHAYQLQPGDRIQAVDGDRIDSLVDLYQQAGTLDGRGEIQYQVDRDGETLVLAGPPLMPPIVAGIRLMSAADDAGLLVGDVILAVNGMEVHSFDQLRRLVAESADNLVSLQIWRSGEVLRVDLFGREEAVQAADGSLEQRRLIGINGALFFEPERATPSIGDAILIGFSRTTGIITGTVQGVSAMLSARISACNLQGPIGIARISGAAASRGSMEFISLIAAISVVIGLLNLVPIPGLDGGHLVFYAYEAVVGREPGSNFKRISIAVGLVLVIMLMGFGLFNDLTCR